MSLYTRDSKPPGGNVAVNWGNPDAPGAVTLTPKVDPSVPIGTYTYPRTGTYGIEVEDQSGMKASASTSVQVSGSGPVATSLSPASVPVGAGLTTVVVTGSAIPTEVTVYIDGQQVESTRVSTTRVDITGDPLHLGVGNHTVVLRASNGSSSAGLTLAVTATARSGRKRK